MKDKEKQIEEMPICVNCIHAYVCEEYNLNRDMLRKRCAYHNDHFVDIKDSVVLSREEYQELKGDNYVEMLSIYKRQEYEIKSLKEANKNLVEHSNWLWEKLDLKGKETAEKIFNDIFALINNAKDKSSKIFGNSSDYGKGYKNSVNHFNEHILELAKQFGVEIKE